MDPANAHAGRCRQRRRGGVGGQLITLGGENLGSVFNTVRALNLTTRAWSSLPNMPFARHGMGVAVIGNSLYAVNGAAQPGHNGSTKTMQILSSLGQLVLPTGTVISTV